MLTPPDNGKLGCQWRIVLLWGQYPFQRHIGAIPRFVHVMARSRYEQPENLGQRAMVIAGLVLPRKLLEIHDGVEQMWIRVQVAATSLCPCSKRISDYGAHNQRSHITIKARVREHIWIEELIDVAEQEASCEVFGILKRPDEKFVTERAYDNPKFVEDIVRDVALRLNEDERVRAYTVAAENFESIHNHSAYALIERDKDAAED